MPQPFWSGRTYANKNDEYGDRMRRISFWTIPVIVLVVGAYVASMLNLWHVAIACLVAAGVFVWLAVR